MLFPFYSLQLLAFSWWKKNNTRYYSFLGKEKKIEENEKRKTNQQRERKEDKVKHEKQKRLLRSTSILLFLKSLFWNFLGILLSKKRSENWVWQWENYILFSKSHFLFLCSNQTTKVKIVLEITIFFLPSFQTQTKFTYI